MKHILIVFGLLVACFGQAQTYSFLSFSNSFGLPQSQVQCIAQDEHGYLWVGTLGGLAKFNGKVFTSFPLEEGLFNNRISSLKYIQGTLYVGHEGGITVIQNNKAKAYALTQKDRLIPVTDFCLYNDKIVASTEGGGIYIISGQKISKVSLKNEDASVCRDLEVVNGKLFIGTRDGLYVTSDLINFEQNKLFKHYSISAIKNTGEKLYISSFFDGLFQTDYRFTKADSIPLKLTDFYIKSFEIDSRKQLWISTPEGVIRLSEKHKQTKFNEKNGAPTKNINCIFEDHEKNIWFGSDGKGLIRFANPKLELYNQTTGLYSDLILSGLKYNSNEYIFGSYDKGAFIMGKNGTCSPIPIPASTIWDIAQIEGKTWFATEQGLFSWNKYNEPKRFLFNESNSVFRVMKQIGNTLYVANESQIGFIKNNTLIPVPNFKLNTAKHGNIRDLAVYNTNLLVATSKGLFELDLHKKSIKTIHQFKFSLTSVEVDAENRIWIGTENGLILYDGITFKTVSYSNNSGAKFINFIHFIKKIQLIGTNDGVYILDATEENPRVLKHIGNYNGLSNLESNINSTLYENSNFWFGTTEGLAKLKINQNYFEDYPPKLSISKVFVNFDELNSKEYLSNLSISHSRNNLSVVLDGIDLDDPESVMYQYMLIGESEKWSPPSPLSTIVLSNISDGNYVLRIRAFSGTKKISNEVQLKFHIVPPFWRAWWFYILCFIVLAFSIRYYFKLQIKRERNRNYQMNLENKSRLLALEQQSLNASMNRHFIFNALNSIQYFINTQDRISANRYLTNFAKLIRKNLDSAVEGDNMVTLQQELERLDLYLSLESMRFKDRFEYNIHIENIDTEHVKVPSMLLQPFVENSIIHGILPNEDKKGIISIVIKSIGGQLEICIDDNGVGIDESLKKKDAFSGDHKSQGMEITSKRIDLIRKLWNQNYELIGPFQMNNSDRSIKGTRVLIKIPYENLDFNE